VSLLLCEGGINSPDVRVLSKLLGGRCQLRPHGPKYGMGASIIARRESIGRGEVFGIIDGDFVGSWQSPVDRPVPWTGSDGTVLGWRWERKEIENYLIDPTVVNLALNQSNSVVSIQGYQSSLGAARDRLPAYQAARAALAASRIRFRDLPSSFGKERGSEQHPFPDSLDDSSCRDGMRQVVAAHQQTQIVEVGTVEAAFTSLLPQFQAGGPRHASHLHSFAGKDLLWAMDDALRGLGFAGAWAFREKVLLGIQQSPDDIGAWLPEWGELQRAIDSA
jgi:hypothetical protein